VTEDGDRLADQTPTSAATDATSDGLTVDARGLRCPMPVIRLAKAARTAPAGTIITVLSTDPAAEPDLAAWCRLRNQTLLTQTWLDAGTLRTQVQLTPP
jgi:tRNA 2-thiouridine synthesizing protein A